MEYVPWKGGKVTHKSNIIHQSLSITSIIYDLLRYGCFKLYKGYLYVIKLIHNFLFSVCNRQSIVVFIQQNMDRKVWSCDWMAGIVSFSQPSFIQFIQPAIFPFQSSFFHLVHSTSYLHPVHSASHLPSRSYSQQSSI